MREFYFTLAVFVLLFMGISTMFQDLPMVGKLGESFGGFNRDVFGLVGYIYPFLLLIPAYKIYKDEDDEIENISIFILSIFAFFLSILILQAMIFDNNVGYIGEVTYSLLSSNFGAFGTFLGVILMIGLSSSHLFEVNFENIGEKFSILKEDISTGFVNQTNKIVKLTKNNENDLIDIPLFEPQQLSSKAEKKESIIDINIDDVEKDLIKTINLKDNNNEKVAEAKDNNNEKVVEAKELTHHVKIVRELDENRKLLEQMDTGKVDKPKNFRLPKLEFLKSPPKRKKNIDEAEIDQKIKNLLDKLRQFKIEGDVVTTYSGPVVTTFEFKPAAHIKVSKILTLQDDLAMALKATTIRIQAPIPGKDVVGIEIPNKDTEMIYLKEILKSDLFINSSSPLTMVVGKDIVGNPFITDLKKLPHLLIAGTTGSGKSVGINAMLISLLYRNSPDDLKFLMIDPKMLEFSIYNDIPHLLTPVITQAKQAIMALANMVLEMEKRYKLMAKTKTKNIENFNEKAKKNGYDPFPYIVIIIDELADLMMTSGKDVEFYIARLAQMARASGIHLIVATQRPSVDVVTGLIKANLPSRMSFKVGQKIDSKVILDSTGADSLLGKGDMLFTPPGSSSLVRLHAPFVGEDEIEKIVEYLKLQRAVEYDDSFLSEPNPDGASAVALTSSSAVTDGDFDELYEDAKNVVLNDKKTSISYIQRRLQIGYNRAAKIIEQLEMTGVLSAPNTKGQREIL